MSELYGFEIVIPYHGQYTSVRNCIESILICTSDCPYRIFLVDDGSKNKNFLSEMKKLSNVVEGIQTEHRGLGYALNQAVTQSKLPWLVFLHSDVKIVEKKWLSELYKTMCSWRKHKVEFVCTMSNNPPNDCKLLKRQRKDKRDDVIAEEPLPIFCSLAPRSLFKRLGGFKEYNYGFYEDEEWFYRMKRFGLFQAVSGASWVEHQGALTVQSLWQSNPETKKIMLEDNRELCLQDVRKLWK